MEKDTHKTNVIFRKFKSAGDILAVFPGMAGTNSWRKDCQSYQHIGQHGACSIHIASITTLASAVEYAPLKLELERMGYNLKVIPRFHKAHKLQRKADL